MLTGTLPFGGTTTAAITYQIVHKPPKRLPRRSDIPKGAQKALARALDKNPAERYQSIPAFINALEEATVGGSAGRPIWAWAAGAMLILALAVTAGLVFARTKPPPKESSATRAVVQNLATVTPTEQNEAPATSAPTALPQTSAPTALPSPGIHLNDVKDNETPMAYETMPPSTGEPAAGTVASNDGDPIPTLIVATSTPPPTPTRIKPKKRTPPTPPPLGTDDGDGVGLKVTPRQPASRALLTSDTATFVWQVQQGALAPNQKYELVFFHCNQDPLRSGFSPIGATTNTQVTVNLAGVDRTLDIFYPGEWCWTVLVGHEDNGHWLRDLNGNDAGVPFTYRRPGGGGGGGAPSPPTSPIPTPPPDIG
jgi:serine/threonine protein kinase